MVDFFLSLLPFLLLGILVVSEFHTVHKRLTLLEERHVQSQLLQEQRLHRLLQALETRSQADEDSPHV